MKESLKHLKKALEEENLSMALAALQKARSLGDIEKGAYESLFELIHSEQYEEAIELIDDLDMPRSPEMPATGILRFDSLIP